MKNPVYRRNKNGSAANGFVSKRTSRRHVSLHSPIREMPCSDNQFGLPCTISVFENQFHFGKRNSHKPHNPQTFVRQMYLCTSHPHHSVKAAVSMNFALLDGHALLNRSKQPRVKNSAFRELSIQDQTQNPHKLC